MREICDVFFFFFFELRRCDNGAFLFTGKKYIRKGGLNLRYFHCFSSHHFQVSLLFLTSCSRESNERIFQSWGGEGK